MADTFTTNTDTRFHAGDRIVAKFTVTDKDAVTPTDPLDLTGLTAQFALSKVLDSGAYSATATVNKTTTGGGIVITDAANGLLEVTLASLDTAPLLGTYHFELEILDATPDSNVVAIGEWEFLRNVTNA